MKKFNFKLQALLRLRMFKEEAIRNELGVLVAEMNKLGEANIILNSEIDEAYLSEQQMINGAVGGHLFQFFNLYIIGKREALKSNNVKLEQLKNEYDIKLKELSHAMGEVKVIDKIKEKRYQEFKRDLNRDEQMTVEELLRMRSKEG